MNTETSPEPADLARIGRQVRRARLRRRWGKEEAGRRAGISSITWKRVEDGLPVKEMKLAAVMAALGLAEPDETTDLGALLAQDPTLSEASRSHIVNQYRLLQRLSAMEIQPAGSLDPDEQAILDSDRPQSEKEDMLMTLRENRPQPPAPGSGSSPTVRKHRAQ